MKKNIFGIKKQLKKLKLKIKNMNEIMISFMELIKNQYMENSEKTDVLLEFINKF